MVLWISPQETLHETELKQKQSPKGVLWKGVLRNFSKFTGKHLCQSLFFKKSCRPEVLRNTSCWLLLDIQSIFIPLRTFLRDGWVFLCNKMKIVRTWSRNSTKLFICPSGHGICTNLRIIVHKLIIHTKLLKP